MNSEEISWLLLRIKNEKRPTRRNIFRGCYDVWSCEQDKIDANEIPKQQLAEMVSMGFVFTEQYEWKPGKFEEYYKLSPQADKYLEGI